MDMFQTKSFTRKPLHVEQVKKQNIAKLESKNPAMHHNEIPKKTNITP